MTDPYWNTSVSGVARITRGHRETMAYADDGECDICDAQGSIIIVLPTKPWTGIHFCQDCLALFTRLVAEYDALPDADEASAPTGDEHK